MESLRNFLKDLYVDRRSNKVIAAVVATPLLFMMAVFFIVIGDWNANKVLFQKWFFSNSIDINTSQDIDAKEVSVQWKTDLMNTYMYIYKNNETLYDEFREMENNYFLVEYKGKKIAEFLQNKKNANSVDDYFFTLERKQNRICVDLKIEGKDTSKVQLY